MASDAKKLQPIIIKRVKKGGHAAHGGAWKIAYADFVTAMMAFFLLMWLLSTTDEQTRLGLADYFSPTIPIHDKRGGGDGPLAPTTQPRPQRRQELPRRLEAQCPPLARYRPRRNPSTPPSASRFWRLW